MCVVIQASRVIYAFSHHPDKLRALEMMEPVAVLFCFSFHIIRLNLLD